MPLSQNSQLLVDALQSTALLHDRFENLVLVNYDSVADEQRGCFSLVFKAFDRQAGKHVALKFYDVDPSLMNDKYRRAAFAREHGILETLVTVNRCLQLSSDLSIYNLEVPTGDGKYLTLPCEYFAVEWIDQEIDSFFFNHDKLDPLDKLHLFNEIVLSVEMLHSHSVFHRDLKADNLRSYRESLKRIVVAIDLGTAARYESDPIQTRYSRHVGAMGYAAPEAIAGLTGNRLLASYTDVYALGCLLYELFNMNLFYLAVRGKNATYDGVAAAIGSLVRGSTDEDRAREWQDGLKRFSNGITPISIMDSGGTVPPGVATILDEVLAGLTHFDYRKRPPLPWVRSKIWSAIKVLRNEQEYQRRLQVARDKKLCRQKKALELDAKLAQRQLAGESHAH